MKKYQYTKVVARCPVCGDTEGRILYTVNADQAAQHFVLREVNRERYLALKHHIEGLWKKSTCDVVSCEACKFCFSHPYVAGDARFYSLAYERSGYPGWKWEYDYALSCLNRVARDETEENIRLLEVGAGNGGFVSRVAPELTPMGNVVCTEYADYGIKALRHRGFKVVKADIRDDTFNEYAGHFNVICLFQVLEHLDRLDELFKRLDYLAAPNAHLILAVPNAKRIEFNELNDALLEMPPNHIGRWCRQSFEEISDRYGWRLLEHRIEEGRALDEIFPYLMHRYMRRRQHPGSFANRVERVKQRVPRRIFQVLLTGLYAATSVRSCLKLLGGRELGSSQVAHFEKVE